jgi:hypothetical protein
MPPEASKKIKSVLEAILAGYSISKKYNYCLEYSVKGLLKKDLVNDSELDLILEHLLEQKVIDDFRESGNDDVISEATYTIYFPDDFRFRALEYLNRLSVLSGDQPIKLTPLEPRNPEIELGKLISYSDGSIAYDGENLELRGQLKVLCRIFMEQVGRLVLIDDIKDSIINSDKRGITPNETVSKYVSRLHGILKKKYAKPVIFNQKKEGWIFSPHKDLDS